MCLHTITFINSNTRDFPAPQSEMSQHIIVQSMLWFILEMWKEHTQHLHFVECWPIHFHSPHSALGVW